MRKIYQKFVLLERMFYNFSLDRGLGIQKKEEIFLETIEVDGKVRL